MGMRPGCVSLKVPPGRRTQSRQNTQYRTPLDPPEGDIVGEQHLDYPAATVAPNKQR